MANNSPTIVAASLSDDQLKKSIESLVTHVDEAMKKMVQSTNNAVGEMEAKLKSLGNLKIDSGGTNDGGASKRTKAQNAETDAVEKTITARGKQIKQNQETAMSFDQIAAALDKARRTVSEFNTSRASGILPSSEDYKRYEQALARIVEYNDKLKQSALSRADANQWANVFDARRNVKDLFSTDERLKQLNKYYAEQEKLSQKATQDDERQRQKRVAAMEKESAAQKKMIDDQYKLSFARTMKIPTDQLDLAQAKLERLQTLLRDMRERGILSNTQIASTEAEIRKLEQIIGQVNTEQQQTTQSAQRYTEEIRKQAQAIRESKQWKETGTYSYQIGDATYYVSKKQGEIEAQLVRHKEQQVNYQKDYLTAGMAVEQNTKQQAATEEKLVQAEQQRLGIEQQITQEKEKQKKKYTSPTSNEWVYNQTLYNNFVKSRLGGKTPVSWKENTSDINTLNAALSQLRKVYSSLTSEERAHPYGQSTLDQIQRLERRLNVLRSDMSRPVSFNAAMGLPEKTLDDIAYKMQRLRAYKQGIDLTKPNATNEIKQVDEALAKLQKDADKWIGKSNEMIKSNTALGRSWNYMKNRLAFYFTVGASTAFIKNLIEVRSQYEMNEKALGILLDSASRGTRIFNELSQMALVSPYTLIELSNAAKQLTAYDIAAKDVVDTTRRLADMASAVGVPVERLTYALGQIKAYGYLNSRDARMFANAGIPLVKQLADRYSELEGKMVSTADVYDRMKKKAIDYNDVMAVINKMTDEGGKFFDFQAKMAETLKVRLANLTLAWNNMLNDMGKDNQGVMTTGLKGLTVMFKHWRELYRVISTAITALGAYKVATIIAGMATKTSIGGSAVTSWFSLARGVKSAKDAVALFSLTLKSIPFTAWVTAIATLASYFILFNNSSDDVKQKLEDIKSAFDGVRKEIETLFADAIKTDNIGTQLTKLRDMLELAETELGVTIPIRLEDVNESNIRQKLKEAKQFVDEYINFSQTFSEAAAGTKFNELMNDFGSKARSTYTNVTESINSVVVALQELSDKGQASKRDIEILNELTSGQKEGESRIEYLQRLVSLYEELGLIGQKKVTPKISFFGSSEDNIEELEQQQEDALNRLGIKNKSVFENMLKDAQGYYSSSSIAAYQFEQQVMRVAEKIDINNIPVKQRTMKLTAAINEEASQNNWNQFEKEFARQIANEKFGTTIEISDESKKAAEEDLQAWQRNIKEWAKNNGITFDVSFQTNDTEASYAKRMLQEAKDAKELWETLGRKEKQGTGSKDATTKAYNDYIERRKLAAAAGADISSLDAKSRKAASKAESELAKALKEELSTIEKVRSIYKDLTKDGMSHANAVERATKGWDETVNAINRVLRKNGLQKLDLSKFAGIENPRELVNMLQSQLNTLLKRGAKPAEIKELQTKIQTLNVDAEKYDLTKITKGLNNELGKLKDEYELAVELDANPELGDMFADMFGIDTSTLPKTFGDALDRAQTIINRRLTEMNITTPFDLMEGNIDSFAKSTGLDKDGAVIKELVSAQNAYRDMFKKNITETEKMLDDYIKKYGDYSDKIAEIEAGRLEKLKKLNEAYYTEEMRKRPEYIAKLNAIEQGASKEKQQVDFDDFKNSRYYTMMFENLDYISTKTIRDMRDRVRELMDTMNDLTPEQLKTLMSQYEKLEQKLVKRSPFKTLTKDLKEYFATTKERKAANVEFKNAQKEYDVQKKNVAALKEKYEQAKANTNTSQSYLDFLQIEINGENEILKILKEQLDAVQKKADKYNLTSKLAKSEALAVANVVGQNLQSLGELRDFLQQDLGIELSDELNGLVDGLSKVGQGINKITSSATSGDIVGVITGVGQTIYGLYDGIASLFGGGSNDKKITEQIQESERAVKRLELAYIDLEHAVEKAYGMATIGANMAAKANKELQLVELKRQLALERSRDSKDRDEDKIIDLQKQIKELEYDIADTADNIVNDLLGISSVGDAMENLMDGFIEALRSGEDAMAVFDESIDEMIANMVKKMFVTKILQPWFEEQWNKIQNQITERAGKLHEELAKVQSSVSNAKMADVNNNDSLVDALRALGFSEEEIHRLNWYNEYGQYDGGAGRNARLRAAYEKALKEAEKREAEIQQELTNATLPTTDDIRKYAELLKSGQPIMDENMKAIEDLLKELGLMKDGSDKNLSALQQGISQISENTAESLEAYMNGVSQQVYYQSSLLEQIRDSVVGLDLDVSLGVQSQMLLQLQNSYQTQQAIQQILEGVLVPSGRAFAVELLS